MDAQPLIDRIVARASHLPLTHATLESRVQGLYVALAPAADQLTRAVDLLEALVAEVGALAQ